MNNESNYGARIEGALWNSHFSVVSFRLEAVRIETRGERKEFAKTLMAKGIVIQYK